MLLNDHRSSDHHRSLSIIDLAVKEIMIKVFRYKMASEIIFKYTILISSKWILCLIVTKHTSTMSNIYFIEDVIYFEKTHFSTLMTTNYSPHALKVATQCLCLPKKTNCKKDELGSPSFKKLVILGHELRSSSSYFLNVCDDAPSDVNTLVTWSLLTSDRTYSVLDFTLREIRCLRTNRYHNSLKLPISSTKCHSCSDAPWFPEADYAQELMIIQNFTWYFVIDWVWKKNLS